MADTRQSTGGGVFKRAAQRLFQILSQEEKLALDEDGIEEDALRLAVELSMEERLQQGYVWDSSNDFGVNAETAAILREEARLLREEQDHEFEQALAMDRTREERQQRQRQRAARRLQALHRKEQLLDALRLLIVPEPSEADASACRLLLRFPDGSRAERRFRSEDSVADVRNFVEALALEEELKRERSSTATSDASEHQGLEDAAAAAMPSGASNYDSTSEGEEEDDDGKKEEDRDAASSRFRIFVSSYPRRLLDNPDLTLAEAGLFPSAVLFFDPSSSSSREDASTDINPADH